MKVRVTKTPKGKKSSIYYGGELDPVEISAYRIPPLLGEDEEQTFPTYPVEPELSDAQIKKLKKALEKEETAQEKIDRRKAEGASLLQMTAPYIPEFAYGGRMRYPGGGMPDMVPIEAEGGEMIQTPNGELSQITGPNHESGGEDMIVPEGSKIYSKRIKIDGQSMAQRKEIRDRKMNRLGKILEKDITNQLYRNTAKRTAEAVAKQEAMDMQIMEVANPIMQQELEAKEQKKGYGGKAKKQRYIGGGDAWMNKGMKQMEQDVYGDSGGGNSVLPGGLEQGLGAAASGLFQIVGQLAQGKVDQQVNPLFAETAHLRPYAGGGKAHWIQGAVNPAHKGYSIGDEYDMPDDEIESLIAQGYKVQRL